MIQHGSVKINRFYKVQKKYWNRPTFNWVITYLKGYTFNCRYDVNAENYYCALKETVDWLSDILTTRETNIKWTINKTNIMKSNYQDICIIIITQQTRIYCTRGFWIRKVNIGHNMKITTSFCADQVTLIRPHVHQYKEIKVLVDN